MFLQRQIAAISVDGQHTDLGDGTVVPYKLTDVLPKYVLRLASGATTSNYVRLNANTSYAVPLPASYTVASRLSCIFRANNFCRLVIVSPTHGTSTLLLKSTTGTTKGNHSGMIMWQGDVTSITINVPVGFDPTLIDWCMFQIPDLADADSYRIGSRAIGVVS